MKTCKVIHGDPRDPTIEYVQILGILENAVLDARMARQFALTSPGHLNKVTVVDEAAGVGYKFYSAGVNSHRRFEVGAE